MLAGNDLVANRMCTVTSPNGVAGIGDNSTEVRKLPAGTTLAYLGRPSPAIIQIRVLDGRHQGGVLNLWLGDIQKLT